MKNIDKRIKNKQIAVFNLTKSKVILSLFALLFVLLSCNSDIKDNSDKFKKGVFEIPAGKGYSKTIITRIDSIQIEEYDKIVSISNDSVSAEKRIKHIDTLYIKWKNNFFYTLRMKSPRRELDKDPIYVQITKITDSSYSFSAKIGFSKFKQDGTVYKVK
ncbi:hypothetical protein BTO04_03060 [Polaribacter sp. SA4-10]|uniref:hypothetical protein n=1 Tax=Polaribacter sp. SA4-10 TaxID=754397 RepID=UPI000B56A07C|nr:hypothetical protein [Polaribacter sp. SA4-10]ARV05739.1 hypothetical protein BTO04_03060 [Polaribacter sp. SA4-10]